MMGPKKLGAIRRQIEEAFAADGDDPIEALNRQLASARRRSAGTEVLEGLRRFLESSPTRKPRRASVAGQQ